MASRCKCGWRLPEQVACFSHAVLPAVGKEAFGFYTALVCPECDQTHVFYNVRDPNAHLVAAEHVRQQRLRDLVSS